MEELRKLPKGWVWVSVGSVYSIIGGGTPSTSNPEYWQGEIPWITSADIYGLKDIRPRRYINRKAINNSTTNLVSEGSLLIVTRIGLGKMALANKPICFSQDLQALTGNNSYIYPKYAMYCLSQVIQIFKYKNRGTTIAGVTKKQLSNLMFPLPPLPEQHRIVDKIEELLTNLDNGIESLKKIKAQLKRYRQAVLKHAFEGKLTEKWRKDNKDNLNPASLLLEQIRAKCKKYEKGKYNEFLPLDTKNMPTLPDGWLWVRIGEVVELTMGQSPPGNFYNQDGIGMPLINGPVEFGPTPFSKTIKSKYTLKPTKMCKENDLILCVRGSTTGRMNIAGFDACIGRGVASLRSLSYQPYLYFYIHSIQSDIYRLGTGSTFPNITTNILHNIPVPFPPLTEQHKIVEQLEINYSVIEEVEDVVNNSFIYSDKLRQSILKRAFEGKLVPQDPNDEPAEKLLEHIKAEKAKQK